ALGCNAYFCRAMLVAKDIHKSYNEVQVLRGANLTVSSGEVVALVGPSGSGKTTLLQIIGTLDEADSGELWFEDTPLHRLSAAATARFRNRCLGFVFQFHHLLAEFSAWENVALPALIGGTNFEAAKRRAYELLERFDLVHRAKHKPAQLSGGEQQRVAVARALVNRPKIILADEPTGNLDPQNTAALFALLQSLARNEGVGLLVVTHNENLAREADRILRLQDGKTQSDV
ncbi:MAG: ABC transporter ATP-binding protein, partial [Bacteroidia bacterium]|nr:ABC transporter ATP-binding protein [Bacteroidia bacterium]